MIDKCSFYSLLVTLSWMHYGYISYRAVVSDVVAFSVLWNIVVTWLSGKRKLFTGVMLTFRNKWLIDWTNVARVERVVPRSDATVVGGGRALWPAPSRDATSGCWCCWRRYWCGDWTLAGWWRRRRTVAAAAAAVTTSGTVRRRVRNRWLRVDRRRLRRPYMVNKDEYTVYRDQSGQINRSSLETFARKNQTRLAIVRTKILSSEPSSVQFRWDKGCERAFTDPKNAK